jgi:beta-glucanase (GH16 family)
MFSVILHSIFIPWIFYLTLFHDYVKVKENAVSENFASHSPDLLWADEFDNNGLPDSAFWSYDEGDHGWGNNELQFYTHSNRENVWIENGALKITARRNILYPKRYTSARLVTKNKVYGKYGYIEVRAKLPEGIGTWPAIWMLPENNIYGGWPASGEIDIMEHVGYDPGVVHGTVHTLAFNHLKGTQKGKTKNVANFSSTFHVYAIDWQEDKIDFFIDGHHYHTFINTKNGNEEWPFDHDFHIILNIAIGGNWGGAKGVDESIWPQTMEIDYVRWYKSKP